MTTPAPSPALAPIPIKGKSSRVNVSLPPQLQKDLNAYAAFYRDAYDVDQPTPALITAMVTQFLSQDAAFAKWRKSQDPS